MALFEGFAALDEHPVDGPHPRADHDGGGGGEPEGTGARDAQHRDGQLERVLEHRLVEVATSLLIGRSITARVTIRDSRPNMR